jgi:hypothetical protein
MDELRILQYITNLQDTVSFQQKMIGDHTDLIGRLTDIITKLKERIENLENHGIIRNFSPNPN